MYVTYTHTHTHTNQLHQRQFINKTATHVKLVILHKDYHGKAMNPYLLLSAMS